MDELLYRIKTMNHFPIQRVLYTPTPSFQTQPHHHNHQILSIEQLRQENQSLKRQLSDLMRIQVRPERNPQNDLFARTSPIVVPSEDVEITFQRKLSKIKASRKSSRKSLEKQIQTTPCSPRKYTQEQEPIRNVTNLQFKEYQTMVIEKNEKGKFFRNKQKEDNIATSRNNSQQRNTYQPPKIPTYSQKANVQHQKVFFVSSKITDLPPQNKFKSPRMHRRADSTQERDIQIEQNTARMIPRKTQTCFRPPSSIPTEFPKEKQHKIIIPITQVPKLPFKQQEIVSPQKTEKKSSKTIVKPSFQSPRGNIYVEEITTPELRVDSEQPSSSSSIPEDSMVSIAKGLKDKKIVRKLRYDIYMSEQVRER